jgi:calcium-dependent protein kinase
MEWLTGGELFDQLVAEKQFSEDKASKIMKKIMGAVAFMHSYKIAHRDLKPENFMFENCEHDAEIKLIDFGMAKKFTHHSSLETSVGTPTYSAPEVLSEGSYNAQCDVWSLGVLLYIMLSGQLPFSGNSWA